MRLPNRPGSLSRRRRSGRGTYLALQAAGKHIPHEVKIVGFDDQQLASSLNPPLTTGRRPNKRVSWPLAN